MIVSVTRADKDCYRVEVNDQIVGFALRLANGAWAPFKADMETRAGAQQKTPKAAAKALIPAVS